MGRKKIDMASVARLREMSAAGMEQTKIARELGVSRQCVQYQQSKPDNQAAIAARREEIAQMFEDTAVRAVNLITDDKLKASSAAQLSIISATQIDKAQLLRGHAAGAPIVNIHIRDPRRPIRIEGTDDTGEHVIEIAPE